MAGQLARWKKGASGSVRDHFRIIWQRRNWERQLTASLPVHQHIQAFTSIYMHAHTRIQIHKEINA